MITGECNIIVATRYTDFDCLWIIILWCRFIKPSPFQLIFRFVIYFHNYFLIGANVNEVDLTGKSALLIAIHEEREKIATFLIKSGCDVNISDKLGQSALFLTSHMGASTSTNICKKLLKAGYDVSKDSEWMDETQVRKKILRRPSLLKRVCEVLRKGVEKIKIETEDDDVSINVSTSDLAKSRDFNDSNEFIDSNSDIIDIDSPKVRT